MFEQPFEAAARAKSETLVERGKETILLVEDEEFVRTLLAEVLRGRGYSVIEALDGADALRQFDRHGSIDLLVTDVVMPGMPGPALVEQLSRRHPRLRVLFLSGYAGDASILPDASFLQKPFTPSTLARKVREVLDAPG